MNALPATEPTRVGDAWWVSLHLFGGDRDAMLLEVVEPAVAELAAGGLVDRFFFIRYPEGGDHLRVRLRSVGDPARVLARAAALLRGPAIEVVPARFELELERYGGARHFPSALAFFALSSRDALQFVARWRGQPRSRQLIEILVRLTGQAAGMARSAAELRRLADYVVQARPRMAPIVARAGQMFESRGAELTQRIREVIAAGDATAARYLSAALADLDPDARWCALGSQLHMSANRLGLSNAEESYLSAILCHALDAIALDLVPPAAPADPAAALDALCAQGAA